MNFTPNNKLVLHSTAVAAGATAITPSTAVDTKGFETCTFIAAIGTITSGAATSIEVHQSDAPSSGFTALAGSKVTIADSASDKAFYVEVVHPRKRYLKLVVNRATQNAVLNSILAVLAGPAVAPVDHDASIAGGELHHAPPEGTA